MNERGQFPWKVFGAELIGTALLVAIGLSIVILDFGRGSPLARLLPNHAWIRLVTGFFFGVTGMLITLSPLGKESGAHINPAVTLGFWMTGRLKARDAIGYVVCQLAGAVIGAVSLLAWGAWGRSVNYAATVPGRGIWSCLGPCGGSGHNLRSRLWAVLLSTASLAEGLGA